MKYYRLRSPFFYVGDKHKLMPQLIRLFPREINTYYEPFLGGGSSVLFVNAQKLCLNDIDKNMIDLHKFISSYKESATELIELLISITQKYSLSCSLTGVNVPEIIKEKYKKTYYAKYNREGYIKLREDYNKTQDVKLLYILLIYGFNHMIRFNSLNEFNLPVGNVDFNKNVATAIRSYCEYMMNNDVVFSNMDFQDFINMHSYEKNDFIYLDPPYLISSSEYNKNWNITNENRLYNLLDELNCSQVKFGLSNLLNHKGETNYLLKAWMKNYNVYPIVSNYISRYDNSIKKNTEEVYITNY